VETTNRPLASGRIYTVDGRNMGSSLKNLPRGLYIVNGKTVLKRG